MKYLAGEVLVEVETISGPSGACVSALIPPEGDAWANDVMLARSADDVIFKTRL